jgi:hypothetical protein
MQDAMFGTRRGCMAAVWVWDALTQFRLGGELVPLYQREDDERRRAGPRVHIAMKTPTGLRVANLWATEGEVDASASRLQEVLKELGVDTGRARFEQYDVINAVVGDKPLDV